MTDHRFYGEYFGETNQGMVRTNNEDTYICQHIWDDNHIICAAIDGLGGYEGGEIAAELARTTILKHLEDFASKKIGDLLKASLIEANNEIIRRHKAHPKLSRMGCVASIGLIDLSKGIINIAHVGDSRIYQFVNGELKKLTHDHSLVGYREETGELSENDAMTHPKRNVIDKYLGEQHLSFDSENYIEISVCPIMGDTQYLFCSDGLTDLVNSGQISEVLSSELSIEDKIRRLITMANEAGGKDNITVVIADIKATEKLQENKKLKDEKSGIGNVDKKTGKHFGNFFIGCICGIIIVIAGMYVYNQFTADSNETEAEREPGITWYIMQENYELKQKISTLEDSIIRLSSMIEIQSTEDYN